MFKADFYDVVVIGGGAAGLFCAATASQRGKRTLLLEVSNKLGKKILMSGGGRCNFTNLNIEAEHFICPNPHFVKSALNQFTQWDFISLVEKYQIEYHEKSQGQLFCDNSSKDILSMLEQECDLGGVEIYLECDTQTIQHQKSCYSIATNLGRVSCTSLVIATGGLSIPTLGGATGFAYDLASQFGLLVNTTCASLVPMTLTGKWHDLAASLSGVSLPVIVSVEAKAFTENMLFTHRGLSGPSILQLSNYWQLGEPITVNLLPVIDVATQLINYKNTHPNQPIHSWLTTKMPNSLASKLADQWWYEKKDHAIHEFKDSELHEIGQQLNRWQLIPSGTEGYRTAEVTRGGVDVSAVSSKTLEVNHQQGLYIIGEALDVTGHLGGYNFQWAWSSGYVAGVNV